MTGSRLRKATRSGQFSIVPNDLWERTDLSYRARGLLIAMTSKPEDWSFRLAYFVERGTEKLDSIKVAYRELRAAGYVRLVRIAAPGGHFQSETWVADEPVAAWAQEYLEGNRRGPLLRSVPDGPVPIDVPDEDPEVAEPLPEDRKWNNHSRPEVVSPHSGQPTSLVTLTDQETPGLVGDLTTRGRGDVVSPEALRDDPDADWKSASSRPAPDPVARARAAEVRAALGPRRRPTSAEVRQASFLESRPAYEGRESRRAELAARLGQEHDPDPQEEPHAASS